MRSLLIYKRYGYALGEAGTPVVKVVAERASDREIGRDAEGKTCRRHNLFRFEQKEAV